MKSPNRLTLAPSILAADHAALATGLETVASLPVRWLHLDIMDGHFVPNFSFGPQTVADLRKRNPSLFFDTHLMLDNPQDHVKAFAEAGSNQITIHIEPDIPTLETLKHIHRLGCRNGLVLNPHTNPESVLPYLAEVDIFLVMTVWPGFGGQSFIHECLNSIETLANWRQRGNYGYRIQVDGGINLETAPLCRDHGADTFVAGTSFFKAEDKMSFIEEIEDPL